MWIKDDFDNSENATGLEGVKQLTQCSGTIWDLTEHGDQNYAIKVVGREHAFTEIRRNKLDIVTTTGLRLGLGSCKHSPLEIKCYNTTRRTNSFGQGNSQTSGPTSSIEDSHAVGERKSFNNKRGSVCLREWVIQFQEPAQPDRKGKTVPTGSKAPRKRDNNRSDDRQKS